MTNHLIPGLSQKDLATKINEKPQIVNDYEAGRYVLDLYLNDSLEFKIITFKWHPKQHYPGENGTRFGYQTSGQRDRTNIGAF